MTFWTSLFFFWGGGHQQPLKVFFLTIPKRVTSSQVKEYSNRPPGTCPRYPKIQIWKAFIHRWLRGLGYVPGLLEFPWTGSFFSPPSDRMKDTICGKGAMRLSLKPPCLPFFRKRFWILRIWCHDEWILSNVSKHQAGCHLPHLWLVNQPPSVSPLEIRPYDQGLSTIGFP